MNIQNAIRKGKMILSEKNIKTAELDSQILMSKAINQEKKFLILNFDKEIAKENLSTFNDLVNQRSKGKPIAYLLKKKNFGKASLLLIEMS